MELLTPSGWSDYELIDTGDREKLERFGRYILARPEPQAVWQRSLPPSEWTSLTDARYVRQKGKSGREEADRGSWTVRKGMPDQWTIGYRYKEMKLTFRLGLTAFGHIGVFPEQAINWDYIYDATPSLPSPQGGRVGVGASRILNLFAYTGGSSLAARSAGADVVHVDSVRPVITWAKEIMEASGLDGIRWVVEDALNFARREAKRRNLYDGIILDPPAYGRGPAGEKWILEDSIDEIIGLCRQLLAPGKGFMVLSFYSMGFSALIAENLVKSHFGEIPGMQSGELYFSDRAGRKLPLGTFLRFKKSVG